LGDFLEESALRDGVTRSKEQKWPQIKVTYFNEKKLLQELLLKEHKVL
jgi:hypothetical protein